MTLVLAYLATALIVLGVLFFVAGTVGLLRLPDLFSRLHALTKADNLGLGLIVLALLPWTPHPWLALKLILIWWLVLLAGATGAHLIAQRALRERGAPLP